MQCADWDFVETNRTIGIPLLKNGSLCNAVIINKEYIVVRETCAFDSIFQIVASSMDMYSIYKTNMTALMTFNDFIKILIDVLTCGKISTIDYATQAFCATYQYFMKNHALVRFLL